MGFFGLRQFFVLLYSFRGCRPYISYFFFYKKDYNIFVKILNWNFGQNINPTSQNLACYGLTFAIGLAQGIFIFLVDPKNIHCKIFLKEDGFHSFIWFILAVVITILIVEFDYYDQPKEIFIEALKPNFDFKTFITYGGVVFYCFGFINPYTHIKQNFKGKTSQSLNFVKLIF